MSSYPSIPTISVVPFQLPERIAGLERLAHNFYWSWQPAVQDLFAQVNPSAWARREGPVAVLRDTHEFSKVLQDKDWLGQYDAILGGFDTYLRAESTWCQREYSQWQAGPIAYFCAEFGLHESFPIYSGGLGILAGDHAKEASDLNLPFLGVGLFYRRGFFTQLVDGEGRQEHSFTRLDPTRCPLRRVANPATNAPLTVSVSFPGRDVQVAVWQAEVGRISLLLLDTDLPENTPEDRSITNLLYVSGREMRLYQEIVLGTGGVRALRALGIEPSVWHLNEGHSAFMLVERLSEQVSKGSSLEQAVEGLRKSSVFTIHTPVPAGNETFAIDLVATLAKPELTRARIDAEWLLERGRAVDRNPKVFDMTAFCLRMSNHRNGVSLLHGRTADQTWRKVTNGSIIGVTNGVHMPTWLGDSMRRVFESNGAAFTKETLLTVETVGTRPAWKPILTADKTEIWKAHVEQKVRLIEEARGRLRDQLARHGRSPEQIHKVIDGLNPHAFTIGFARRFATYKRASLIFKDEKRLQKILNNADRPVQIIFAGKAHPADRSGQKLIAKIFEETMSSRFGGKVFFIENYDMEVGRLLVQGVDIWLNNPRRPLEASGTSGMKAAANGVPNCSVLDGWWDEAYNGGNGWAIGDRTELSNEVQQDKRDANELYRLLESEIVPLYFKRNSEGLPEGWIDRMQQSIATSLYDFSTARMLSDYMRTGYAPVASI